MKQIAIGPEKNQRSAVIQGCMRIANLSEEALDRLIKTDLENGVTFFDNADITDKRHVKHCSEKCLPGSPNCATK